MMASSNSSTTGSRKEYLSWSEYFMGIAFLSGMRSKDPNTKVGACIVDPQNRIVGIGYNGFPGGCSDEIFPWSRETPPNWDLTSDVVLAEGVAKSLDADILSAENTVSDGAENGNIIVPCDGGAETEALIIAGADKTSSSEGAENTTSDDALDSSKDEKTSRTRSASAVSKTQEERSRSYGSGELFQKVGDGDSMDLKLRTKYPYICHAAINAILNSHNRLEGCVLYTSLFPNDECCKLIVQSGISYVVYASDKYRNEEAWIAGRRLLDLAGVETRSYHELIANPSKNKRKWAAFWSLFGLAAVVGFTMS